MDRQRTHDRLIVISEQAKGADRLGPKRTRLGVGSAVSDRHSPPLNPVKSAILRPRKTNVGNGVTLPALSTRGRAWSRCQPYGREREGLSKKHNAWGNAQATQT